MALKLNAADLAFVLRQIKISEAHAAGTPLTEIYVDADGNVVPEGTVGAVLAISDPLVPYGLRTVDGSLNNLVEGREQWGAADQAMPRMLSTDFRDEADGDVMPLGAPGSGLEVTNTDYGVEGAPTGSPFINGGHSGNVADADPRIISNLVNSLSTDNPAAVEAWFASDAALAAFHEKYGEDAIPVRPGEGPPPADVGLLNTGFELDDLTPGTPGVFNPPAGAYTRTAPIGWDSTGRVGTWAPEASTDLTGFSGEAVAWLGMGGSLSQDAGTITANADYELTFRVGDRAEGNPINGVARLVAVAADGSTTVISEVPTPALANLAWADMTVSADKTMLADHVGETLRVEIARVSGGEILIDDVNLTATSGTQIEITDEDLQSLPNIAPDDGISAPFNAWMTFFGQFFDHGLDLITKGDNGTIFIPLQADDPLVLGEDGIAGTADDLPNHLRFMAVTRSTPVDGPGADGIMGTADDTTHEGQNTTTPFVDQNQTYTSHASHQVFTREYAFDASGNPVATGHLLDGANGGLATWAEVKAQARDMLGIELTDGDVLNIPLLRTDAYGEFVRGPNGLPQIVVGLGPDGIPNTADDITVEGDLANPVNTFTAGAIRIGHAFLDDIAHAANPFDSQTGGIKAADSDSDIGLSETGTYDNELLDRHFITGDGRGNENIGLTAVHHVFHSEHNRQVDAQKLTVLETGDLDFINEWLLEDVTEVPTSPEGLVWDGERLFQAGRFATEMQYQHLVFEEFGRKIHPNIDPFVFNAVTDINPAIFAEFANTVYRFGHSMLTEAMPRVMVDETTGELSTDDMGLIAAFLNPVAFDNDGAMSADEAAAAIVRGMSTERGSAIDEFVVDSLRNNLLGLPLDLPAINIARGRDTGIPSFNDTRAELYAQTGSTWLRPYENWVELANNLSTPTTIINLIAAYGTHASITSATTLEGKRDAAFDLVMGGGAVSDEERFAFLLQDAETSGLNNIDLWVGGLAERTMPFGGMLGSTFTAIFEAQMEALQFGDRFYYLSRTQGQNLLNALEENSFAKMILANTNLSDPGADGIRGTDDDIVRHHIGADAFGLYDFVLEVNQANQLIDDPTGNDPILEALGMGKVVRDDPTTTEVETNYLRFSGGEHVVVGGTNENDTIITGDGDDAIWGDAGDDYIESGFGVDQVLGGGGSDIILDAGDEGDFLKGEAGDDIMATSNGLDVLMGGSGKDVVFLGADASEVFGGSGDDFILGGDGADFLLGNEGDDWMEAGNGFDTTAGDNSELFFNSSIIGHDVMFAGEDEHDFDAESGDDIMVQGESVMRNEGMWGFDWAIFKGVPVDGYADMRIKIFTTDQEDILRNRFDKTEALSGWDHNDTLIGDNRIAPGALDPAEVEPGAAAEGVFERDGLDQAGIDRIAGLSDIVSIADGETFWEEGNILLGGAGSDMLQGNAGDDILDGDRWLNVRIRITADGADANEQGNEIATVDTLTHVFTAEDGVDAAWVGQSLFELLVSRTIVPGQMHIVREIIDSGDTDSVDVAIFNDDRTQYTLTYLDDGSVQVEHTGFGTTDVLIDDGSDIIRNVEILRFRDGDVAFGDLNITGSLILSDMTPTEGQVVALDTSMLGGDAGIDGPIDIQWQSFDGVDWVDIPGATGLTYTPNDEAPDTDGIQVGRPLRAVAAFLDGMGVLQTVASAETAPVGDDWMATLAEERFDGTEGDDIALGDAADNRLAGNGGDDLLEGGAGTDRVDGGAGNDTLVVDFAAGAGGRDLIDGGLDTDTFVLTGDASAEQFTIMTSAAAAGFGIVSDAEIVITRGTINDANVIAEIDAVEEIIVNSNPLTAGGGAVGGDTIVVLGDFTATSLNFNTITINGSTGDDEVDITGLNSAHRIVFKGEGGNDTIVGTLRPQDVIEVGPLGGPTTTTTDASGMTTVSGPNGSVMFHAPAGMPGFVNTVVQNGDDDAADGSFGLTQRDLDGLSNLVKGLAPFEGSDDGAHAAGIRTLSGEGNNIANPEFGAADEPFIRLTEARYGDADDAGNREVNPIFDGLDPRTISNVLGDQEVDLATSAKNANALFTAFGQYFDHGLTFIAKDSANGTIAIGGEGSERSPTSDNPADLTRAQVVGHDADGNPMHVNKTSPFIDQNQAYGSHELVGQFLRESDGNQGFGMRLLSGEPDPSDPEFNLLPTLRDLIEHHWAADTIFTDPSLPNGAQSFREAFPGLVDETTGAIDGEMVKMMASDFMGSTHALLIDTNPYLNLLDHRIAGDGRANENVALTSIHTIWARNHTFHVENLVASGFEGSPEEVFQAAKLLNVAEYQRVVYEDFADMLLGGMRDPDGGTGDHGWDGYDDTVDARISHEFAAAVYRFGHSMISETVQVMGPDGNPIQVPLFDAFLNPTNAAEAFNGPLPQGYVPQPGYTQLGTKAILEGATTQAAEEVDFNIVDAVRNDLVRVNADLFSFNVARGWDIGLGTLNQVRADLAASTNRHIAEAVGLAGDLSPYADWGDFQARNGLSNEVIAQLMEAYPDLVLSTQEEIDAFVAVNPGLTLLDGENGAKIVKGIDRVDLWVGGLAEKHVNGGMVGQTFWVVIHEQLDRLQEGDRFYYIDQFDNFDFYQQFGEDTTFASIVDRNSGIEGLDNTIFDSVNDGAGDGNDGGADNGGDDDNGNDDNGNDDQSPAVGDAIVGSEIAEAMFGTDGADNMLGLGGNDMMFGGEGSDNMIAGAGNDMMFGDAGNDRMFGDEGDDFIDAGAGNDFVVGGEGDDMFLASVGDGSDVYYGDAIEGGTGTDTLDMSAIMSNITADLGSGTNGRGSAQSADSGNDVLWNVENFLGGSGDDVVTAGKGVNEMDGGAGADTYRFLSAEDADGDIITGFEPGDRIDLTGMSDGTLALVSDAFTGTGEVMVSHETRADGDYTVVQGNLEGDNGSEFSINIKGRHDLSSDDFML
ncbi:peroxidase family protein [uncultured Jannaschia sp.]|uniref:peroxidase family protein n=1 Tax=uncultured Jannaschia sp. TaxID=293347 RepID=UPI00261EAEE4|nr:peroxidase family protein [uncultured Jannaschia sp.]